MKHDASAVAVVRFALVQQIWQKSP